MIDIIEIKAGEVWVGFCRPGQASSGAGLVWPYLRAAGLPRRSVFLGDGSLGDGEASVFRAELDPRAAFFMFGPLRVPVQAWAAGRLVFAGHVSRLQFDQALKLEAQT